MADQFEQIVREHFADKSAALGGEIPAKIKALLDREAALIQMVRELRENAQELLQAIGKVGLQSLNDSREEENDWPCGQGWGDLGTTSQSACRHKGAEILGIDYWKHAVSAGIPGAEEAAAIFRKEPPK